MQKIATPVKLIIISYVCILTYWTIFCIIYTILRESKNAIHDKCYQ